MYALKVTCKAQNDFLGRPVTKQGRVVWVVQGDFGWTSSAGLPKDLPHLIAFEDKQVAENYAAKWKGHPWYYLPEKVEVVEVKPRYKQVLEGWDAA